MNTDHLEKVIGSLTILLRVVRHDTKLPKSHKVNGKRSHKDGNFWNR